MEYNIQVKDDDGKVSYVKTIDQVNGTLEFTDDRDEAYTRDGHWYITSEIDFLQFHFKKKYPIIETATEVAVEIDDSY